MALPDKGSGLGALHIGCMKLRRSNLIRLLIVPETSACNITSALHMAIASAIAPWAAAAIACSEALGR